MKSMATCETSSEDFLQKERRSREGLLVVLMADDDAEDYLLVRKALEAGPFKVDLRWAEDGQEAMDYLLRVGRHADRESSPRPDLIILDLMMPRKDGLEALKEIKGYPDLRKIPVVLLTSAQNEMHKASGMRLGADSFIIKPRNFSEMVSIMGSLHEHFFGIIRLPDKLLRQAFLGHKKFTTPLTGP